MTIRRNVKAWSLFGALGVAVSFMAFSVLPSADGATMSSAVSDVEKDYTDLSQVKDPFSDPNSPYYKAKGKTEYCIPPDKTNIETLENTPTDSKYFYRWDNNYDHAWMKKYTWGRYLKNASDINYFYKAFERRNVTNHDEVNKLVNEMMTVGVQKIEVRKKPGTANTVQVLYRGVWPSRMAGWDYINLGVPTSLNTPKEFLYALPEEDMFSSGKPLDDDSSNTASGNQNLYNGLVDDYWRLLFGKMPNYSFDDFAKLYYRPQSSYESKFGKDYFKFPDGQNYAVRTKWEAGTVDSGKITITFGNRRALIDDGQAYGALTRNFPESVYGQVPENGSQNIITLGYGNSASAGHTFPFVIYYETELKDPAHQKELLIPFIVRFYGHTQTAWGASSTYQVVKWTNQDAPAERPKPISDADVMTLQGYYDSPILEPDLFSVPVGSELPKGLHLVGHFEKGDGIKDWWLQPNSAANTVNRELQKYVGQYGEGAPLAKKLIKVGSELDNAKLVNEVSWRWGDNTCGYTNQGYIDFAPGQLQPGEEIAELWTNLGQNNGSKYSIPKLANGEVADFKFDIFATPKLDKLVDFNFVPTGQNRLFMHIGYLPAYYQDKVVPVKIYYWLSPYYYTPYRKVSNIRIRPYVLKDKNPLFPLNPVAVSPYRNLVNWLNVGDKTIQNGSVFEQDVIPGFLKLRCELEDINVNRPAPNDKILIPYSPGEYYEDGAPWIIGDERRIGFYQNSGVYRGATTNMKLSCVGLETDANQNKVNQVVPINGLVLVDAETTDGIWPNQSNYAESISITNTVSQDSPYYPISGFSSCDYQSIQDLAKTGPLATMIASSLIDTPGTAYTIDNSDGKGIIFNNQRGRCGQANQQQYGAIFGPSLMVSTPIHQPGEKYDSKKATQKFNISLNGNGNEGIGIGVILAGDTSNANFNKGMPPVLQYSSLSFKGKKPINQVQGSDSEGNIIDWSNPNNYSQNFYYYGSRLGKTAKSYNPANNTLVAGEESIKDFLVRSGKTNDALPAIPIKIKQGNDPIARVQQVSTPNKTTYQTDSENHFFAASTAKVLSGLDANGLTLQEVKDTQAAKDVPLKVTVPCGNTITDGRISYVRGWADFNGNGVFDESEGSDIIECTAPRQLDESTSDLVARNVRSVTTPTSRAVANSNLGLITTTKTADVTLTFNYPKGKTNLNGKRNVWMRLRSVTEAVGTTQQNSILNGGENSSLLSPTPSWWKRGVPALTDPVRNNPDAGTETATASFVGSYTGTNPGETEDYLFDITPPVQVEPPISICLNENGGAATQALPSEFVENSNVASVLPDSMSAGGKRNLVPDKKAAYFIHQSKQPKDVTISDNGKTAVTPEGTYKINDLEVNDLNKTGGTITFTPSEEFIAKRKAQSDKTEPTPATKVLYAIGSQVDNGNYNRQVFAESTVEAAFKDKCTVNIIADILQKGEYKWAISKQVLQNNDAQANVWTQNETRELEGSGELNVPLTYRFNVSVQKVVDKDTSGNITGVLNLDNTTGKSVTFKGIKLVPSDKKAECTPAESEITVGGSGTLKFTCSNVPADNNFSVNPYFNYIIDTKSPISFKETVLEHSTAEEAITKAEKEFKPLSSIVIKGYADFTNSSASKVTLSVPNQLKNANCRWDETGLTGDNNVYEMEAFGSVTRKFICTIFSPTVEKLNALSIGQVDYSFTQEGLYGKGAGLGAADMKNQKVKLVDTFKDSLINTPLVGSDSPFKERIVDATKDFAEQDLTDGKVHSTVIYPDPKSVTRTLNANDNEATYTNTVNVKPNETGPDAKISTPEGNDPITDEKYSLESSAKTIVNRKLVDLVFKVEKRGGTDNLLPGADFALYADNNGTKGALIENAFKYLNSDGTSAEPIENLRPGLFQSINLPAGTYWVVETKAPMGHQLLAQPVKVELAADGLKVLYGGSDFVKVKGTDEADKFTLYVRDVEIGTLPASGGHGLLITIGLGGTLVIFGAARRRQARLAA